jgi:hypothetical protein
MALTRTADTTSLSVERLIEEARQSAAEQLEAAWQLHVERVEEQLRTGWREHIQSVLDERFADLASQIRREAERVIAAQVEECRRVEAAGAAREATASVHQSARRLFAIENLAQWTAALSGGACDFAERAAVLTVSDSPTGRTLALSVDSGGAVVEGEIPIEEAPAFQSAVESGEPVVSLCGAREISATLESAFGPAHGQRAYLFPVWGPRSVVAVLYADGDPDKVDVCALELLSSLAGAVWQLRAAAPARSLLGIAAALPAGRPAAAFEDLPAEEREVHMRAQRFARVQVAELRLYKSDAVKNGRAAGTLYALLREDIDRGREVFRAQYVDACASMVDYFHAELVRTLANDDASLLGSEYPGPLV